MEASTEPARPGEVQRPGGKAAVIYDGHCRACAGFAKLIRLLDIRRRSQVIPAQDPRALELVPGETREDLLRTFHLVTADGRVLTSGEAMLALLALIPGLSLLPKVLERLPGHRVLANRLYAWVARNRRWISYFA